ncbi:hypothetical protein BOTBODRAFT_60213 [Botryobasidium botryosum FD-172 SS1]|uniref:Uncharacterized protein n=1 Tax=Botryobasidium botryosum (strain FD-172 SS1) TaxID=930990 RepID=A0A067M5F5_BOTB1|nr:hypothetical protein BOTBODRAFT_60213 [Botryobasidium botryosum FD-172 SS1]
MKKARSTRPPAVTNRATPARGELGPSSTLPRAPRANSEDKVRPTLEQLHHVISSGVLQHQLSVLQVTFVGSSRACSAHDLSLHPPLSSPPLARAKRRYYRTDQSASSSCAGYHDITEKSVADGDDPPGLATRRHLAERLYGIAQVLQDLVGIVHDVEHTVMAVGCGHS